MAILNKKKPKKKASPTRRKPKPQTTALAPVKSQLAPFVPYRPSAMSALSMDKGYTMQLERDKFYSKKSATAKSEFAPEKEFLKTFKELTRRHRAWDVWNDFIIMAACSLSNPVDKAHYEEREARYLRLIKKYDKDEQNKFPELFAQTVMALELNPEQDFLGKLYMDLNLHDDGRKQHFTPYNICRLMADITMNDVVKQVRENGYVTLNDPCCGAGATLIAGIHSAKRHLEKAALNFQNHILVSAQDIDETVALMCYIQLSLLGVAAYIKVGNTLTEPMTEGDTLENYWFTPMYFSDVWAMRRLVHKMDGLLQSDAPKLERKHFKFLVDLNKNDCYCSLLEFYENVAKKAGFTLTDATRFDCTKIRCTKKVQTALFDFYSVGGKGSELDVSMLWVNSGPKADLDGSDYSAEIEDGFIVEVND